MHRFICALLFILLLTLITACDSRNNETKNSSPPAELPSVASISPAKTSILFKESLYPVTYELPSGALATWRKFAVTKPVLLLFSAHPFLDPLKPGTHDELIRFIRTGTDNDIDHRGRMLNANPAFLPPQTLSLAIAAGLFSEIVYVMPTTQKISEFSLVDFQKRSVTYGFFTESEAAALTLQNGVIGGTLRGIPFRCVHPDALPKISAPTILHVDLGYFNDMFVNEVKTPSYGLLHNLMTSVRNQEYPVLAATLSYSNQEAGFSLDSRFMISNIAEVLRNPALLSGNTPPSWTLRADALYASTMFSKSKAEELTERAAKESPDDPAALHALALLLFRRNQPDQAFVVLDRAVALDKGYALEYSELAERGKELGQWAKSIELLQKATECFPENDFVKIRLVDALIQRGRVKEARPILSELLKRPWSDTYHKGVPELLNGMSEAVKDDSIVPLTDEPLKQGTFTPSLQMPPSHMGIRPNKK